jgi:hypothetical protein
MKWNLKVFDVSHRNPGTNMCVYVCIYTPYTSNTQPPQCPPTPQPITCFDCLGSKSEHLKELFTLLDFESFLKVLRIVGKSLPHPVGVFCMLQNPPKCHIIHKSKLFIYVNKSIKNHLESHQDKDIATQATTRTATASTVYNMYIDSDQETTHHPRTLELTSFHKTPKLGRLTDDMWYRPINYWNTVI